MTNPANTSTLPPDSPETHTERGFHLSMGLVEISALASILGASSAEALAAGSRGIGGLPWAVMSTFGMVYVIKGCIAVALTDRTREAMGLRSNIVDFLLGLDVPLQPQSPAPLSLQSSEAVMGIWVRNKRKKKEKNEVTGGSGGGDEEKRAWWRRVGMTGKGKREYHTAFTLDRTTQSMISSITVPKIEGAQSLKLYRLRPTTRPKPGSIRSRQDASTIEWLAILLSFSKAFESLALYKLGSSTLAWLTAVCWLYATVSAIVMEFVHLSESTEEHDKDTRDLITGELPSAVSAGGSGHIILDLPRNFRRSGLWRSMLLFQSFACIGVLIAVFVLLGSQPKDAVYVWVGFQVLWLLCRIAFNQLFPIQPSAYAHEAAIAPERWELAEPDIQRRFFTTLCALSVHIANTHPRGYYSYRQDALELEDILHLYFAANCQLTHELPISSGSDTSSLSSSSSMAPEMKVIGVIGDATFRATNWLHGILDTMEIYDATIVFIELCGQIYAVPAVRVLSDTIQQARALKSTDPEAHYPSFDPRGMGNLGQDSVRWVYWIPIPAPPGEKKERYWLESHGNHILNEFKPIIVSQTELGRFLERGVLNISWTSERETWESLLTARETSRCLFQILKEMTQ